MKKRLMAFLLVGLMTLSFGVPAMASEVVTVDGADIVVAQEIYPVTEMTQIFWRTYNGQLQFRVWSLTNGRWLTDWTNMYEAYPSESM